MRRSESKMDYHRILSQIFNVNFIKDDCKDFVECLEVVNNYLDEKLENFQEKTDENRENEVNISLISLITCVIVYTQVSRNKKRFNHQLLFYFCCLNCFAPQRSFNLIFFFLFFQIIGPSTIVWDIEDSEHSNIAKISKDRLSITSSTAFSTLKANACIIGGKYMFEVQLKSKGVMQIGFCSAKCLFTQVINSLLFYLNNL